MKALTAGYIEHIGIGEIGRRLPRAQTYMWYRLATDLSPPVLNLSSLLTSVERRWSYNGENYGDSPTDASPGNPSGPTAGYLLHTGVQRELR